MSGKHSRLVGGKRHVWFTPRLWRLAADLQPFDVPLAAIRELDMNCWFDDASRPTLRAIAEHSRRIHDARMDLPIILAADGSLMDGGHRVCRAWLEGATTVLAVRFPETPPPDEIREHPDPE